MLIEDFKRWLVARHPAAGAWLADPQIDRTIKVQYTVEALRGRLPIEHGAPDRVRVSLSDAELAEGLAAYLLRYMAENPQADLERAPGDRVWASILDHWIPE